MTPAGPRATPMSPAAVAALPAPGAVGTAVGALRIAAALAALGVGSAAILASAAVPLRLRGTRLSLWATAWTARALLACFGVELEVEDPARLRAHRGFVFFNHFSWIDPVVLMAATPVRFLAAAGVRRLPLIGWVGRAVGTVFVNRGDGDSRRAARSGLREAVTRSRTPVALAPEGGIQPGPPVRPFRHGAFEVAAETRQLVLPVALDYAPWPRAAWQDGETLVDAAWRVAARRGPFRVRVAPLGTVAPTPGTVAELATALEARFNAELERP